MNGQITGINALPPSVQERMMQQQAMLQRTNRLNADYDYTVGHGGIRLQDATITPEIIPCQEYVSPNQRIYDDMMTEKIAEREMISKAIEGADWKDFICGIFSVPLYLLRYIKEEVRQKFQEPDPILEAYNEAVKEDDEELVELFSGYVENLK